jgi:hypothetical protein
MFAFDEGASVLARLIAREEDHSASTFCESLKHRTLRTSFALTRSDPSGRFKKEYMVEVTQCAIATQLHPARARVDSSHQKFLMNLLSANFPVLTSVPHSKISSL